MLKYFVGAIKRFSFEILTNSVKLVYIAVNIFVLLSIITRQATNLFQPL